jgi:hypothetical protein
MVDDSGTPASPNNDGTLVDKALMDAILDNINAMWSGATQVFSGVFDFQGLGTHQISSGGAGHNTLRVENTSDGTDRAGTVEVGSQGDADQGRLEAYAPSYTETAVAKQSGVGLRSMGAGGLSLSAEHASGVVRIFATGITKWLQFNGENVILSGAQTGNRYFSSTLVDSVDATQQGTPASSTETSLRSYTLPASTLAEDDRMLRITSIWTIANNSAQKDVIVKWGSTEILNVNGTMNDGKVFCECYVLRTGASTQKVWGDAQFQGASGTPSGKVNFDSTAAETLSGNVTIDFRGQSDGASANDVVYQSSFVELLN